MGPNSSHSELIYHDDMVYNGWIGSQFIFMHNGILVNMQGSTGDNKQVL